LTGNNLANIFDGGAGNDIMNGGLGNDDLNGEDGLDTFTYVMGNGADNVNGGSNADTLNIITAGGANDTLDVIVNAGGVVTSLEGGVITSVETINVNLGGGNNTITYAGSASGVTVNLQVPSGTGLASLISVQNVTGTAQADTLTGSNAANILNGGAGSDIISGGGGDDSINGGAGGDTLTGGIGADDINTGAANDDLVDLIRFSNAVEFGDEVTNFDANGTVDRVEFGGTLNTLFDNEATDDNIQFVSGDGNNNNNTAVNLSVVNEALFLNGANGEGVTNGDLDNAGAVATEFNAEFNLTAGNGEATLLVINDTNGTSAAVWRWVQADGDSDNAIDAAELTLIGVINANATVTTASFDFF
jgi:Ca2+-binding RTX toxin-like protein